jgi:hypothetical protein
MSAQRNGARRYERQPKHAGPDRAATAGTKGIRARSNTQNPRTASTGFLHDSVMQANAYRWAGKAHNQPLSASKDHGCGASASAVVPKTKLQSVAAGTLRSAIYGRAACPALSQGGARLGNFHLLADRVGPNGTVGTRHRMRHLIRLKHKDLIVQTFKVGIATASSQMLELVDQSDDG